MPTVVLFRSASNEYQQELAAHGLDSLFVEPLQFLYVNTEKLTTQLQKEYDGLILTSPRAVEAVSNCWSSEKYALWYNKKIYTVGEASRERIRELLGLEAVGHHAGNAANLAKIIIEENDMKSKFLFPCGNISSETLPLALHSAGIKADTVTVYETREHINLQLQLNDLNNSDINLCGMVFFSPSGCEFTYRRIQTIGIKLLQLPCFAIGNSTASKLTSLGLHVAGVASNPNVHNVVAVVCNYYDTVKMEQ